MDWLNSNLWPLIGVTGPDRGGTSAWLFTKLAVWLAGGKAQRITPSCPGSIINLEGLVIGGGSDVDPECYGETLDETIPYFNKNENIQKDIVLYLGSLTLYPLLYLFRKSLSVKDLPPIDRDRDKLEYTLIEQALIKGLPILGICRGAQLLNIFCGGSLYQNIIEFYEEVPQIRSVLPKKHILIEPESKLGTILKTKECRVNALHNQAIKDVGKDIIIAAQEPNNVIQAIEHCLTPFVIGVQWHPEYMPQEKRQRAIFRALIKAALSYRSGKAENK